MPLKSIQHAGSRTIVVGQAKVGTRVNLASASTLQDKRTETPVPNDAPAAWVYILAKIDLYLSLGTDKYRTLDALHLPDAAWDEDTLQEILSCFQQFAAGKGYRSDKPTESISVGDFYAAMKTLHFTLVQQSVTLPKEDEREGQLVFVDKMHFKHAMFRQGLSAFNIPSPNLLESK